MEDELIEAAESEMHENTEVESKVDMLAAINAPNLVPLLDQHDVGRIGTEAVQEYQIDLESCHVFWVASSNNALAIAHDLPLPLPPYKTLYRDGLNRNRVLGGNCALIIKCNFYFDRMGNWFSINSCMFVLLFIC